MKLARCIASVSVLLLLACGATSRNGRQDGEEVTSPSEGGATGRGGAAGAAAEPEACAVPAARFVRLTFPQLVAGLGDTISSELEEEAAAALELGTLPRMFIELANSREGDVIAGETFQLTDDLAQRAGRYISERFELTGCEEDDFGCVSDYIASLAERAFRRPVADEELEALLFIVERAQALNVSARVAAEYGVYGVFSSPRVLYRTELGDFGATGEVPLDDYELASNLAYFLSGRGPDASLLGAAESGQLRTNEAVAAQVSRIVEGPTARAHLQQSLALYLGVSRLPEVRLDPERYPEYSPELASAMMRELDELFAATLWSQPVQALLTTRTATLNPALAALYGVAFPPAGSAVDASGFARLELPQTRAGLLTRAGMLLPASSPDGPRLFARGVTVATMVLCDQLPPAHADMVPPEPVPEGTARAQAEYRMREAACRDCHQRVDPFGIALEELDSLGRFREKDELARPIDPRVTLPDYAGGATVNGAVELSDALPGERFASCLGERYLARALSPLTASEDRCQVEALARELSGSDASFSRVLEKVAVSRAFRTRRR